ncbi:MAG: calcium-binding protein, partial [Phenylobacterium sp.]
GVDLISYAGAAAGVAASLTSAAGAGSGTVGEAAGDVLSNAEGLRGSDFNDTLGAVGGAQTLSGGSGNDIYVLSGTDAGAVTVVETAGQGLDEMRTSTRSSLTLAANVETLTNLGSGAFTGIGNALANLMTGGSGNDILRGGEGADTLIGGQGQDLASYLDSAVGVTVGLAAGATRTGLASGDVFIGIEGLEGSNAADSLSGDAEANLLSGLVGNDTLTGGSGADTLDGGVGVDVVSYAGAAAGVAVSLTSSAGTGTGTAGEAAGDVLANVEMVVGSAFNDTLGAVGGAQTLSGGAGDDVYVLDGTGAVTLVEAAGQGLDEMRTSTRSSLTLAANVETLTNLGSGAFTGTGNELANLLTGGTGNDLLQGLDGADTLTGGSGADTLNGGVGVDRLTGGDGTDLFVFGPGHAGSTTEGAIDQITDFTSGADRLKIGVTGPVQVLTAETSYASALASATTALASGSADIVTASVGTTTYVFADTNNDNLVDTVIALTGPTAPAILATDFVA